MLIRALVIGTLLVSTPATPAPERRQSRLGPAQERRIERLYERIRDEQDRRERYRNLNRHDDRPRYDPRYVPEINEDEDPD